MPAYTDAEVRAALGPASPDADTETTRKIMVDAALEVNARLHPGTHAARWLANTRLSVHSALGRSGETHLQPLPMRESDERDTLQPLRTGCCRDSA